MSEQSAKNLAVELESLRTVNKDLHERLAAFAGSEAWDSLLPGKDALFSLFMQHLPTLAFIKDDQGRYVYVNRAARHILKVDPALIPGNRDHDLLPPETAHKLSELDHWVLTEKSPW